MYDPESLPDPDSDEFIEELREKGLDDEQIEQAQQHVRHLRDLSPEQREATIQSHNDVSMGMSLVPRYTDTEGIKGIAQVADQLDYNRQISDEGIAALDPEGFHLLKPWMIHRYAQGEEVAAHMRCRVFLKLAGKPIDPDDPLASAGEVVMDVPMKIFVAMPEARDENSDADFQEEAWRVILGGG